MGEHEGLAQQRPLTGLLLNGLLPSEAASVIPELDKERWAEAEERTAKLISCIQPNQPSEDRRTAVADYVQRLIMKCFPCQVFKFGSVPLKTYLPDGDIDLTAFSKNQNLKETWAHQVRDILENEEKNENAEFRVKEVQYIQAEVKIIKCLVENIVVDISFNQLGGLCTLCFLEEVDNLINHSHLFKRSIILIKAWCYYESRILGAHHGLISTYALETLVLYIFHVFNNSFLGPLEVLYRFLEFFSKFDWDNYCVSLWGPVPISSLPDVTAPQHPRKDGGDILLSELFLEACSSVYAVLPAGQENQGQPFVSKHFNVIDPLRVNNNLGRSVSKGNFFRIRSAFAFGAKKLARVLDCPKEDIYFELNQFFMNTWERHGSGHRPDAPRNDLWRVRLSDPDRSHVSENIRSSSNNKNTGNDDRVDTARSSHNVTSQHGNFSVESMSRSSEFQTVSRNQSEKTHVNSSSMRLFDQTRKDIGINQGTHTDKSQRSSKLDNLASDLQGRYLFARTRSSPELTDTYGEVSSQGRRNRITESGKGQSSGRIDNSRRKDQDSDNFSSHGIRSSNVDPSSVRHASSRQVPAVSIDSNSISNSFHDDANVATMGEEFVSNMDTQGMHQHKDYENPVVASAGIGFNGQVHVPLNLASSHILPFSPSVFASMGQRNLGGVIPSNFPLMETTWGANVQFPPGFVSSPLAHYFQGMGLTSNPEDSIAVHENFGSVEMNQGEADQDFWHEHERASSGGLDNDNGSFESHQSDDKQQSSAVYNSVPSSKRVQQKFSKESRAQMRKDQLDTFSHEESRGNEHYLDERVVNSRSFPTVHGGSLKSRTSSESSWEGSSAKASKPMREKKGRKTTTSTQSAVYGKGKSVSDHSSVQADDDNKDWNATSNVGAEMIERDIGSQSAASLHVPPHQIPGFEPPQSSGSESLIPFGPVLLGPGSRQRTSDNAGVFAFYPTGPPVPFVTMVPVYNFSPETGTSDALTSQFSGEDGLDSSDSSQNLDSSEGHDQSEGNAHNSLQRTGGIAPMEHKSDILSSDFASHWQNLQYGRFCQDSHYPTSLPYHSPVMVPPMYLQGRFPWDGPGRPPSTNMNLFTQLVSYGPRIVPFAPLQSASNRPTGVYQHYLDEMPRYRGGTGTYLPNPKVSVRDRHSTNTRKGNYSYDRNDHHGDREWNSNPKSRAAGRSHSRSHVEKSSSRLDRLAGTENRADRPWSSHRHDTFPSYQSQNGPIRSSSAQSGSANVAYGMYPLQSMNPGGVSSNGPSLPPVVMLYPYDNNVGYGSPTELEFGSLGPVGFSGANEISHLIQGSQPRGVFEDQRFHGSSTRRSSPDQPSSPHQKSRGT